MPGRGIRRPVLYPEQRHEETTTGTATEKTEEQKARSRGYQLVHDYGQLLRNLQSASIDYTEESLRPALTSAQNLKLQWRQLRAAVNARNYIESGVLVWVIFDISAASKLTTAIEGWCEYLSGLLNSLLAGVPQSLAEASSSETALTAGTGIVTSTASGIFDSPLVLVGLGLVLVMLLRK